MALQAMVLPPAWIGIMGGGQLGMMLAIQAKQMGYKVAILEPDHLCPASRVADYHIQSAYNDQRGLAELAAIAAVVTSEFENVPATALDFLSQTTAVYPAASSILVAQNRLKEKSFFTSLGLKTAPYLAIRSSDDCNAVEARIFPAVLKTTTLGYDGKGQQIVNDHQQLSAAFNNLGQVECILEKMINLKQEVSLIIARNNHGSMAFPLIENQHHNGILAVSYIPAQTQPPLLLEAVQAAQAIVAKLNYTGLMTIEFFISAQDELLVNEIAPRPHNSGHITLEACQSSQFEMQLRAVCGLPLADCALKQNGAMLNLLGDVWLNSTIDPFAVILKNNPQVKLHNYGKQEAKPGRKMGHLSLTADSRSLLEAQISKLKQELRLS